MVVVMMISVCLFAEFLLLLMLSFSLIDRGASGETTNLVKLWTDGFAFSPIDRRNVVKCVYRYNCSIVSFAFVLSSIYIYIVIINTHTHFIAIAIILSLVQDHDLLFMDSLAKKEEIA